MTPEESQAAKAKSAQAFATGREEALKRYGIDPNSQAAPPTMPSKR